MTAYVLSPRANRDIFYIWLKIAKDSVATADEVERAILRNCEFLTEQPYLGRRPTELTRKAVLIWPAEPYRTYRIVYRPETLPLQIVRVLHTARRKVWRRGV